MAVGSKRNQKGSISIMQREKALGKDVRLVKDKLFVDNVQYKMTSNDQNQAQNFAPQSYRYVQPQNQPSGWYQGHTQPGLFGTLLQQSTPRQWIPPPPPVPPGQPGAYQWIAPAPRMAQHVQQTSQPPPTPFTTPQHVRQPMPSQQQIPPLQQGPSQPNQPIHQNNGSANNMQHDG